MIHCRFFIQLAVFLGPAILLLGTSTWAQPSRCSGLFINYKITAEEIEQTLHDLAEMKLHLDQAQATGNFSTGDAYLASLYKTKLNEVAESLVGQMSQNQIRDSITDRIRRLQNKETPKPAEQKKEMALSQLEPHIDLDFALESLIGLKYLPRGNSLVIIDKSDLYVLNLESQKSERVEDDYRAFQVLDDGFVVITKHRQAYRYNAPTKIKQPIPIQDIPYTSTISPSGEMIAAATENNRVVVYNTRSGKRMKHQFTEVENVTLWGRLLGKTKEPYANDMIGKIFFINDSELLVRPLNEKIYHFNINTGESRVIDTGNFRVLDMVVNKEDGTLLFSSGESLARIKASDIGNFTSKATIQKFHSDSYKYSAVSSNLIYLDHSMGNEHRIEIADAHTFKTIQIFTQKNAATFGQSKISGFPAVNPSTGNLYIGEHRLSEQGLPSYHIKIWKPSE